MVLPVFMFIGVAILIVVFAYLGHLHAKKRREAFQVLAQQWGFRFYPAKDFGFAKRYQFLDHMDDGHKRYAYNRLSGQVEGAGVNIFDYHYETYSTDSKGRRTTNHHHFSIFTMELPRRFPELTIEREGFFSKIGQALGFDDIDFESLEFSKRYKVKSQDKKFAYDFCNAQMIDYLMKQQDLVIEVDGTTLALTFPGRLAVERVKPNFIRLQKIRGLMPNYLFDS
ncbi:MULTISPECIES: hypothetical protein [unclassified Lentimonas]|uniref:hypothetical protein n=1 Tax=unclassified Lentimonas TaxID=2630993 RepID=UPI001329051B|nr:MULTISPECIES: hypothetical protein [unclassified Lentimonas]CAA6696868.1 Unannotated [Lentimonas sp. CC10]CAA6696970.1 Unannotated [Lentimonas sp. CC19]CAA7071112.1 Unannotated [Lentimonas sp. CC11]